MKPLRFTIASLMILVAVIAILIYMRCAESGLSTKGRRDALELAGCGGLLRQRAWAGYSLRALALVMIAMVAAGSILSRWRDWLWTEWAASACATVFAGCWAYDEFVCAPALDRTVRAVLLGTWLLVLAVVAAGAIWAWSRLGRRFREH